MTEITSSEYQKISSEYECLGKNVVEALKTFLRENDIPFLDIYYRIKAFDSFSEKIDRKHYDNPFDDIEDICGIRIISYYISDIPKISKLISEEFSIIEEEDKADLLGLKEFAYRSKHFIIKINKKWTSAPNYRGLEKLKAEIQVRTILMHAWAEIEHKLNYKSDSQVPDKFQRKLFRLSAKFEEADEQFEELKTGIDEYKKNLQDKIISTNTFNLNQNFNIDTYRAYLKFHFPVEDRHDHGTNITFESYSKAGFDFKDLDAALKLVTPYAKEIFEDLNNNGYPNKFEDSQSELLGIGLDILHPKRYKLRKPMEAWCKVVDKWSEILK